MPSWLSSLLLMMGKPALIAFLLLLESKFPGAQGLINAIIVYLEQSSNPQAAAKDMQKHFEEFFRKGK